MIEHLFQHILFDLLDYLAFWVYAGIVCGGIWIHERWFEKK